MAYAMKKQPLNVELQVIVPQPDDKAFPKLSEKQYYDLLNELTAQGVAASKKNEIIAFPLFKLGFVTLNNKGGVETVKDLPFENHLVFDASLYSVKQAKSTLTKVFKEYAHLTTEAPADLIGLVNKGEVDVRVAASAEGVWTLVNKNFRADYAQDDKIPGMYHVKPGTGRLCLSVGKGFKMPVQWGDFNVREGGTVAIRFDDLPKMVTALDTIRDGKASIHDALYDGDKAKFDIYGMDPGFFQSNYAPAKISEDALKAVAERQGLGDPKVQPLRPTGAQAAAQKRLLGGWGTWQRGVTRPPPVIPEHFLLALG